MKIALANTYIQPVVLLCTNTRTSDICTHQCKYNISIDNGQLCAAQSQFLLSILSKQKKYERICQSGVIRNYNDFLSRILLIELFKLLANILYWYALIHSNIKFYIYVLFLIYEIGYLSQKMHSYFTNCTPKITMLRNLPSNQCHVDLEQTHTHTTQHVKETVLVDLFGGLHNI